MEKYMTKTQEFCLFSAFLALTGLIIVVGGQLWTLALFALLFAPFIVAYGPFRSRSRVGVWKFLAFALSGFTVVVGFIAGPLMGIIVWFIAWVFAGIAVTLDTREQPILIEPARKSVFDIECPHCHEYTNRFAAICNKCNEQMGRAKVMS
jgi:hypothetical protein